MIARIEMNKPGRVTDKKLDRICSRASFINSVLDKFTDNKMEKYYNGNREVDIKDNKIFIKVDGVCSYIGTSKMRKNAKDIFCKEYRCREGSYCSECKLTLSKDIDVSLSVER